MGPTQVILARGQVSRRWPKSDNCLYSDFWSRDGGEQGRLMTASDCSANFTARQIEPRNTRREDTLSIGYGMNTERLWATSA